MAYYFGILNRIQNEADSSRYKEYCRKRYNYEQLLDRERQKQKKNNAQTPTIENLAGLLFQAVTAKYDFIADMCKKQAKRMAGDLMKQASYAGVIKKKITDAMDSFAGLSMQQRQQFQVLIEQLLH